MQYIYRDAVWSVWNKYRGSIHRAVQPIWNKVSSAGKQTKIYFDYFYTVLDRLSNHSSAGYAIVLIVNFAAMLFTSVVAVEFFYHIRPYYWMIMKFFISLLHSALMFTGAILKFLVIITTRLTLWIFARLATNGLLAFHGVVHVAKLVITPVTSTSPAVVSRNDWKFILQLCFLCGVIVLTLFWRRRVTRTETALLQGSTQLRSQGLSSSRETLGTRLGSPLRDGRQSMPFSWQFKESDSYEWRNFGPSDNVAIEKLYCDVEKLEINMVLKDTSSRELNVLSTLITANFEDMSMTALQTSAQFLLRRLSTPSYIKEPGNVLSTKWIWYWQDDDGWKKYAATKKSPGTKQEDIEAAYLKEDQMYFFQIGTFNYIITFYETSMYQRNMDPQYFTKRKVRRRPLFASESVLQTTHSELKGQDMDFERIALKRGSSEQLAVSKRFHETIPERKASILMVEKINNDYLRERYNRKREQMKKKLKASNHNEMEKLLFHGTTSDVIDAICKQNIDHRMRGKNGTVYGEGSYFAVAASYSNNYSSQSGNKTRFMFLASVLTGEYKLGGRDLLRPPLKDPSNPASDLYDSCVDKEDQPNIFVIFNDEQCFPLYLIKYRLEEL